MGRGRRSKLGQLSSTMELETAVFVGNASTVVGFVLVAMYAQQHFFKSHGGPAHLEELSLRHMLRIAPLTLFLLLLRDDGGFLAGLSSANRYAMPMLAVQVKLAWASAHSLFVRGAPFLVTPSIAAHARASAHATPAAILGIDLAAVAQAKAWRALSFWTAPELSTPVSELVLLLAVLPTHSAVLSFVWSRRPKKVSSLMLLLPLNILAAIFSQQFGTQMLGWLGLAGGVAQIFAMRSMVRISQQRL
jgi:hypothetical protein